MPSRDLLDACDRAGMLWDTSHAPDGVAYSGATQTAYLRGCDDWEAAHELAHWLLASPKRRSLDEFGGGPGQHTRDGVELVVVLEDDDAVSQDEQLAQALTVAILVALGFGPEHFRRYNTWHRGTLSLDWAELRRRGFLTEGNVPVFLGDVERVLEVPGLSLLRLPESHSIPWWPSPAKHG